MQNNRRLADNLDPQPVHPSLNEEDLTITSTAELNSAKVKAGVIADSDLFDTEIRIARTLDDNELLKQLVDRQSNKLRKATEQLRKKSAIALQENRFGDLKTLIKQLEKLIELQTALMAILESPAVEDFTKAIPEVEEPAQEEKRPEVQDATTQDSVGVVEELPQFDAVVFDLETLTQPQSAQLEHFVLPEVMTIADMERSGQKISPEIKQQLDDIKSIVPLIDCRCLTPVELKEVADFAVEKFTQKRNETSLDLVDFAAIVGQAANSYMAQKIPKKIAEAADRVQKAERANRTDFTPHQKSLELVAFGTLMVLREKLLERNIDLAELNPTGEFKAIIENIGEILETLSHNDEAFSLDPVTLLTLRKIQADIFTKRQIELTNAMAPKIKELIQFHAELILKLRMRGKKLSDFADDITALNLVRNMAFLRSCIGYSKGSGILTPKQETNVFQTFQEYRITLQILMDNDQEFAGIVMEEFIPQKGDAEMAKTELTLTINDATNGKTSHYVAQNQGIKAFHTINTIIRTLVNLNGRTEKHISLITSHEGLIAIKYYLGMNEEKRSALKKQIVNDRLANQQVAEEVFELLDKYIAD